MPGGRGRRGGGGRFRGGLNSGLRPVEESVRIDIRGQLEQFRTSDETGEYLKRYS